MWKEIFLFSGFLMVLALAYPAQDSAPVAPGAIQVHLDDAELETLSGAETAWGGWGGGWGHRRGWGYGGWGGHHHHHHHHGGWGHHHGGWGYGR